MLPQKKGEKALLNSIISKKNGLTNAVSIGLEMPCAEKGIKGNCYIGPREDVHRCLGVCATILAGRVEPYTGKIHYGMLTFDDFLKVDSKPMNKNYKNKDLQDVLDKVLTGKVDAPLLAESPSASVIKHRNYSVKTILEQVCALSKSVSNNKIDSVRRSPTDVIGELAKLFVLSMSGDSLINNPNMSNVLFRPVTRLTKSNAQKAYSDDIKKEALMSQKRSGKKL